MVNNVQELFIHLPISALQRIIMNIHKKDELCLTCLLLGIYCRGKQINSGNLNIRCGVSFGRNGYDLHSNCSWIAQKRIFFKIAYLLEKHNLSCSGNRSYLVNIIINEY